MKDSIIAVILTLCILNAGCLGEEEIDIFYGEDIVPAVHAEDFTLIDENGQEFTLSSLEGKIVVIAFLFTRCPDICPIVSANLAYISQELGDHYENDVAILSITVDPWTDNTSVLANYASDRGLNWPHLTGGLEVLEPVWVNFDVGLKTYDSDLDGDGVADGFDICADTPEGEEVDDVGCGKETQTESEDLKVMHHPLSYWVDHTTGTIILDKEMNQRVWWGDTDWNAELVMEDILILMEE
ncbi:MAG TPA: SCO family protein [Candidatus Poseidoniales archaeon]|nr:SCO family protein [Candidatus Poseidoniales archaeon]HIK99738.1 SCO family protein [Candidatus Poseidoniales archaeon]